MAKYSIQDTTLTAIGDAIRNKSGKHTRPETETYIATIPEVIVSKTPNNTGPYEYSAGPEKGSYLDVVSFPGASSIYVHLHGEVYFKDGSEYIQIAPGEYNEINFPKDTAEKHYYSGDFDYKHFQKELTFSNTDVITFHCYTRTNMNVLGYYAECKAFDADGNPMGEYQVELEREVEVKNTLTPAQMATEIEELPSYDPPAEALEWSGDLSFMFRNGNWDWFVNDFGDRITTKDISSLSYFATGADTITRFPFDFNIKSSFSLASQCFQNCNQLIEAPRIVGTIDNGKKVDIDYLFGGCKLIKEIPNDYFYIFGGIEYWKSVQQLTSGNRASLFSGCNSLRKLPDISMLKNKVAYYSCLYSSLCASCYSLEGIEKLPVLEVNYTSSPLSYTASACYRLKTFTFETNEDGTPKTAEWKSQSLGLNDAGFVSSLSYRSQMITYGNSEDKEIVDDTTYQALKDDPDSWTANADYSRYNKLSAIETINSLPDTSAYLASAGGANYIKFKGNAGALTDGGAINTLTEEEIAVAAAKGWTVSFAAQKGENL